VPNVKSGFRGTKPRAGAEGKKRFGKKKKNSFYFSDTLTETDSTGVKGKKKWDDEGVLDPKKKQKELKSPRNKEDSVKE